jgi:hypothetical protein
MPEKQSDFATEARQRRAHNLRRCLDWISEHDAWEDVRDIYVPLWSGRAAIGFDSHAALRQHLAGHVAIQSRGPQGGSFLEVECDGIKFWAVEIQESRPEPREVVL